VASNLYQSVLLAAMKMHSGLRELSHFTLSKGTRHNQTFLLGVVLEAVEYSVGLVHSVTHNTATITHNTLTVTHKTLRRLLISTL
jgi:hypothetical protein